LAAVIALFFREKEQYFQYFDAEIFSARSRA
jgi:hypothetical protein